MRVLVTGASGMLGQILCRRLAKNHQVLGVSLSGRGGTVSCDLRKEDSVRSLFREPYRLVIHTAAYSDVDGCERDPRLAHESNALSTQYLAQCCGENRIPFIYVSTDYVFDGRKRTPYEESDPVSPVNIYGMTKLEGEAASKLYPATSSVVRTSWLFGPNNPRNFVNAMIDRLRKEKTVGVLDDQVDSPTYVDDLAGALERIGDHLVGLAAGKEEKNFFIFQVCNGGATTRLGLTLKIKEYLGLKDVRVEKMDKDKIKGRIAIRPEYGVLSTKGYEVLFKTKVRPWETALKDYLEHFVLCAS
jgi:dTDP-4-dehydrorhamnose reductase